MGWNMDIGEFRNLSREVITSQVNFFRLKVKS